MRILFRKKKRYFKKPNLKYIKPKKRFLNAVVFIMNVVGFEKVEFHTNNRNF